MELAALLVIQVVATAAVFGLMWRKLDAIGTDVAHIKRLLETLELMRFSSAAQKRAAQPARAEPVLAPAVAEPPSVSTVNDDDPYSASWVRPGARVPREDALPPVARQAPRPPARRQLMANEVGEDATISWRANITPETGRIIAAASMALAPVIGFALGAPQAALVASGLSICAALMLAALRPLWAGAAFVGAIGAGGWTLAAFGLETAQSAPLVFAAFTALAGVAGLAHTRLRSMAPGLTMAVLMGGALIALGNVVGMIGPAGVAYSLLVALAAGLGASASRLSGLHLTAFAAAILGLYLLSGETPAAIWFTPVTAWIGALFFAIAAVRIPTLGASGALFAATGTAAPLLSAGALSLSQHGLANPYAAAGAFLCLAVMFCALIAVAAQRDARGVAALRLTAWVLLGGAALAWVVAALLALPTAFASSAAAAAAMGLVVRDFYKPQRLWRAGALALFLAAAAISFGVLRQGWPNAIALVATLITPTALAAAAAYVSRRRASTGAAAVFETIALVGVAASAVAFVRLALAGGAPNTMPIGFVEAGVHVALWATLALALASRAREGAQLVRRVGYSTLAVAALSAASIATLLWLTPFWSLRFPSGVDFALFQHAPLGFALPAIAAWAHWAFWRGQGVQVRTRVSLAAAALLTAAFLTLEIFSARQGAVAPAETDWIFYAGGAAAFIAAFAVNMAPGVTDESGARLRFDKYFQRDRRRQQRT